MEDAPKKTRKKRSDAGIPRKPQLADAPIHVRIVLKGDTKAIEFGCASRTISNGFQVFFYPSEQDRYRMTRREFAISEIRELEITEAQATEPVPVFDLRPSHEEPTGVPRIHTARAPRGANVMEQLATAEGPIQMAEIPGISIGGHSG